MLTKKEKDEMKQMVRDQITEKFCEYRYKFGIDIINITQCDKYTGNCTCDINTHTCDASYHICMCENGENNIWCKKHEYVLNI